MDGTSIAPLPVYIWLNRKGSTLIGGNKNSTIKNISWRYVPQKESCFNCTKWMSSHTQTSSQFICSVCADWPSSSSKCRTLVKSFISKPVSPLRSSVVEVPSSNIWRQHEFNTAIFSARFLSGLGALSPCEIQFKATGLLCSSVRSMLQKQFSFFVAQWMNMRRSSPQQISRGHLRQQLEIQRSEQFKLSA